MALKSDGVLILVSVLAAVVGIGLAAWLLFGNDPPRKAEEVISNAEQGISANKPERNLSTEENDIQPTSGPADPPPLYENQHAPTSLQLFVAAHPTWISRELGVKLQNAGYNSALDPDLMSAERWFDKYGVDEFELISLRKAFKE